MKIRNKTTGEIETLTLNSDGETLIIMKDDEMIVYGVSLEDLVQDWEDCKELKEYWYLENDGDVGKYTWDGDDYDKRMMLIGNYFETKKEAEQAAEKLRAWKRLKDTYHISFDLDFVKNTISFTYRIDDTLHSVVNQERIIFEDIKTIFGGEDE